MRGVKRSAGLAASAVACLAAVVIVGTATAVSTAVSANSVTYQDSTGETSAPDISTVVVSNDEAGLLTFAIGLPNRSSLGTGELVAILIDSDSNPLTGEQGDVGEDYDIEYYNGRLSLWRYDPGSQDWVIAPMSSLRSDWVSGKLTVYVNASELGATTAFRFFVWTDAKAGDSSSPYDQAPDRLPLWTYSVKYAPVLGVGAVQVTPAQAEAGKPLAARTTVTVTRGGKPEALPANATVVWTATAGTQQLKPASSNVAAGGVLTASWQLPKTIAAKSVKVTVSVTMEGVTATGAQDVQVRYVAPVLRVTSLDCTPEPAVVGRTMSGKATVVMTRNGVREALPATTKATWVATVGNLRLRPTSTRVMRNGVLLSSWKLPKTVSTNAVRITLTVSAEGVRATKLHVHRIG